jgi:menaquinol-cytochrome c reductase iron-sulfur subunit
MTADAPAAHAPPLPPTRRNFLVETAAIAVGAVVGLAPVAAGIAFLFDPLLRRRPTLQGASEDGFLPVASIAELPSDGTPLRFAITADKVDAWNLFKKQTVGTVYLRQIAGQVIAFNDTCPHLGCKVDYKPATKTYFCPCHASSFDLDGKKTNQIPPRGMDALETRVTDGRVWVKYQNFQRGVADQKEV